MIRCATGVWSTMDRMQSQGYLPEDFLSITGELAGGCLHLLSLLRGPAVEHSILAALSVTSTMACKDDRDRLFALLSLGEGDLMLPDYGLSTTETYVAFATHMVCRGNAADIVHVSAEQWKFGRQNVNLSHLGLPTWVPDLRMRTVFTLVVPNNDDDPARGRLLHNVRIAGNCLTAAAKVCHWSPGIYALHVQAKSGDYVCQLFRVNGDGDSRVSVAVIRPTNPLQVDPVSFTVVESFLAKDGELPARDVWEQQIELY